MQPRGRRPRASLLPRTQGDKLSTIMSKVALISFSIIGLFRDGPVSVEMQKSSACGAVGSATLMAISGFTLGFGRAVGIVIALLAVEISG